MIRIFASLSVVACLLVGANLIFGLAAGDYNTAWQQLQGTRQQIESLSKTGSSPSAELASARDREKSLHQAFLDVRGRTRVHLLLGLLAVLMTIFVNSLSVTYFVGTGRWCKEVTQAYSLSPVWIERSTAIKRKSFPWALLGMVWVGMLAGFGAASDPGTLLQGTEHWVPWHSLLSLAAPAVLAFAFYKQWEAIRQNQVLLASIMQAVQEARTQRGLPTA